MVEIPDALFVVTLIVFFFILVDNIHRHRMYKKAVDYGAKADMTIQELKIQLQEKDKLVDLKDVLYNASVFGSGNPSTLLGKIIRFNGIDYECKDIKVYSKPPTMETEIPARDVTGQVRGMQVNPEFIKWALSKAGAGTTVDKKWRNNTFTQLDNAIQDAGNLFLIWEFRQRRSIY